MKVNEHTRKQVNKDGLPVYLSTYLPVCLFTCLLVPILLSSCAPIRSGEQPVQGESVLLRADKTVGQTFVARYDGLAGIEIFINPEEVGEGEVRLHLRRDPHAEEDIWISTLPVETLTTSGFYRFPIFPLRDSNQQYYYFYVEVGEPAVLRLRSASGDTYLNGSRYQNHEPRDEQLTFRLVYDPLQLALGLVREGLTWLGMLLAGVFLFVLPGWGLISWLWRGWQERHWPEKLALSSGVSLVIYPILLVWTDLVGLHFGLWYAWLPPVAGLTVIVWRNRYQSSVNSEQSPVTSNPSPVTNPQSPIRQFRSESALSLPKGQVSSLQSLIFILIILLVFAVRFWMIRGLEAPMWGDSYQHTMVTQLLVDNGGLFDSWEPYTELVTFTYHFGFHTAAALLHWITNLPMIDAVLWTGQILNGLAVLALYPLSTKIGKSPWAGVVTVLIAGLLTSMPNFYVNWGRYTQLAGQVILPTSVYLAWVMFERQNVGWRLHILNWIALGGLALTHYRVLIIGVLFLPAYWLIHIWRRGLRAAFGHIIWLGIGAGVLFAPWFINVFGGKILNTLFVQLSTSASAVPVVTQNYNAIGDLSRYLPDTIWLVLPFFIGWGLWKRNPGVGLITLWWLLILLAANPGWLGLPGAGVLSNFAVFIAAYIPASILIGAVLGDLMERLYELRTIHYPPRTTRHALLITYFVLLIAVLIWGVRQRLRDLNVDRHMFVTRPDVSAGAWIQENTPQEARFLVNSFFDPGGAAIVGSDGGWWLPLLFGRTTTLPPLTYVAEEGPRPDYREWVNALIAAILADGVDHPDVLRLLKNRGVTHVYIGQRQGRVGFAGPVLEPEQLLASPHFTPVYHQDNVWVFALALSSETELGP